MGRWPRRALLLGFGAEEGGYGGVEVEDGQVGDGSEARVDGGCGGFVSLWRMDSCVFVQAVRF